MIIRRSLGEKGQVVIPKDIREILGLKKGNEVVFEVKEKGVMIKKADVKKILEEFFTIARS